MTDIIVSSQSTQLECDNVRVQLAISWINRKLNTTNKLLNYIAQVIFSFFFSSTGGVFRAFCCAVWQWYTEHQTGNVPKPPFYSSSTKQFSCNGLSTGPVAETLHEQDTVIEMSRIENRYCTRDKKRSPSKEQLMQCKSFKLLRIANSGL